MVERDSPFKVYMVGGSGSGKTSYMGAMFYKFGDNTFNGFSITMEDQDAKGALVNLGRAVVNGIFPDGDAVKRQYEFLLRFKGEDYVRFNWYDYRGGILSSGLRQDRADKYDLLSEFKAADALIFFFDITEIVKDQNEAYLSYLDLVSRTLQREAGSWDHQLPMPVSLVFTKLDTVRSFSVLADKPLYKKFYDDIFLFVKNNDSFNTLLTATAIGVRKWIFFRSTKNVEYPFLHILSHIIKRRQDEYTQTGQKLTVAASAYEPSILNSLACCFSGEESEREKRNKTLTEASRWDMAAKEMDTAVQKIQECVKLGVNQETKTLCSKLN